MAEIRGISGEGLGIDDSIYDDCRTIGNKTVFLQSLRAGMFDDLDPDEMGRALAAYGMTSQDLDAIARSRLSAPLIRAYVYALQQECLTPRAG